MTPPNPKEAEVAMELPPLPKARFSARNYESWASVYAPCEVEAIQRAAVVAALAQAAPQAAQQDDVPADLRFLLEYIPHTAARREAIRKVEALVASRRAGAASLPDVAMPEQIRQFVDAVKSLCNDYCSRTGVVYIRDVEDSLEALAKQFAAQPAEGAAPAEPVAFSCAKRAADPSNEFATCRKWCGDCENCYCVGCSSCSPIAAEGATPAGLDTNWQAAIDEVARATLKFPTWPTDPLHAVAVLGEEFGELTKAVLQTTYEPHKVQEGELRTEAIQTAAMALRFLASLSRYEFTRCPQHKQHIGARIDGTTQGAQGEKA